MKKRNGEMRDSPEWSLGEKEAKAEILVGGASRGNQGPGWFLSGDGGDEASCLAAKPEFPDDDPVLRRAAQALSQPAERASEHDGIHWDPPLSLALGTAQHSTAQHSAWARPAAVSAAVTEDRHHPPVQPSA